MSAPSDTQQPDLTLISLEFFVSGAVAKLEDAERRKHTMPLPTVRARALIDFIGTPVSVGVDAGRSR